MGGGCVSGGSCVDLSTYGGEIVVDGTWFVICEMDIKVKDVWRLSTVKGGDPSYRGNGQCMLC